MPPKQVSSFVKDYSTSPFEELDDQQRERESPRLCFREQRSVRSARTRQRQRLDGGEPLADAPGRQKIPDLHQRRSSQREFEGRTFAFQGLRPYASTMTFNNPMYIGQANTRAGEL